MKKLNIHWKSVDWTKPVSELAKILNCSTTTVDHWRKKVTHVRAENNRGAKRTAIPESFTPVYNKHGRIDPSLTTLKYDISYKMSLRWCKFFISTRFKK